MMCSTPVPAALQRNKPNALGCFGRSRPQHCIVSVRAQQRHNEERPVFQLDSRHNLTFEDVRDAYEVCSLIPDPTERVQCYSVFGIDAQRMNNYYETVSQLEGQLSSDFQQGAPCVFLSEEDPDDYHQAPAECSYME
eukprot:GHUV01003615.1.p1 GENE.GHUV01003615.1~~GHUV01003615.1.p1  ORF type:complete len:137 (+),score=18.59 GHUV01003615.1:524-934(+)